MLPNYKIKRIAKRATQKALANQSVKNNLTEQQIANLTKIPSVGPKIRRLIEFVDMVRNNTRSAYALKTNLLAIENSINQLYSFGLISDDDEICAEVTRYVAESELQQERFSQLRKNLDDIARVLQV